MGLIGYLVPTVGLIVGMGFMWGKDVGATVLLARVVGIFVGGWVG